MSFHFPTISLRSLALRGGGGGRKGEGGLEELLGAPLPIPLPPPALAPVPPPLPSPPLPLRAKLRRLPYNVYVLYHHGNKLRTI